LDVVWGEGIDLGDKHKAAKPGAIIGEIRKGVNLIAIRWRETTRGIRSGFTEAEAPERV